MSRKDLSPRLRWIEQRTCAVPGCDGRAPGTHPFCREHARKISQDEYLRLRFQGDKAKLAAAIKQIAGH